MVINLPLWDKSEALWLLGVLPEGNVKDRLRNVVDDLVRRGVE